MASTATTSTTAPSSAEAEAEILRPYTGSCHCGAIRYVVRLALPPISEADFSGPPVPGTKQPPQFLYRCNCTACHKAGVLHLRLRAAPAQFALLSPLDPLAELADYRCGHHRRLRWLFCRACGVRCFTFSGEGEVVEGEIELPSGTADLQAETRRYWRPAEQGWQETLMRKSTEGGERKPGGDYLSVNAMTLDAGQDGVDLVRWVDEKRILYMDHLEAGGRPRGGFRFGTPFAGGAY